MRKLLLSIGLIICSALLFGQLTATLRVGDVDLTGFVPGDKVYVPVYVDDITSPGDIITMQMFIAFDHAVLSWDGTFANPLPGVQNFHPNFPYGTPNGSWMFNDNGTEMALIWDDPMIAHIMPPGGMFFEYIFTYLGGSTNLTWGIVKNDEGKGATELYNGNFDQYSLILIDGYAGFPNFDVTFHVTDNQTGNDVAGAEVTVGIQTLITDANGIAVFNLANGSYSYTITAAGYTNKAGNFTVNGANLTIDVAMNLIGSEFDVTFQVTSGGNNLEGATVTVGSETAITNALGEAVIPLADGDYSYSVSKYGYTTQSDVFTVAGAAMAIPVDLPIEPHYDIIFHVTDDGLNNLDGAMVDIEGVESMTTDLNGEALFSLIDGTYNYTVTKSGFTTETGSITVNGSGFTESVMLSMLFDITFHVTADGSPVQNAQIVVGSVTKYTNASGNAVFSLTEGLYTYTVTKSGFETVTDDFTVTGNQTIDVILTPAASDITFHITDITTGLDLEGATVIIGGQQEQTNASGIAEFSLLDGEYLYVVNKAGYFDESDLIFVAGATMDLEVEMTPVPLFNVTIHVSSNGVNLTGAAVTIGTTIINTDANGNALFTLAAGNYDYSVVLLGFDTQAGSFLVTGDMTHEVYMTPAEFEITFHVTSGGNPLTGAVITINPGNIVGATNTSGDAVFNLINGNYTYIVVKSEFLTEEGDFTVLNANATINVDMEPQPYTVTFHAVGAGGALEGVTIVCEGQTVITNIQGNATLDFPAGFYTYVASKPGYVTVNGDFTIIAANVIENIIMQAVTATFIITHLTQPISGAEVTLTGYAPQTTPANGTVVFSVVPNGTYDYTVDHPDYGPVDGSITIANEVSIIEQVFVDGVNDISESSFSIYPNPSNGVFNLTTTAVMGYEANISVYDLAGKLVYTGKLEGNEVNVIDLSSQDKGMYMMQIIVEDKVYNKTIVIQ